MMAAAAAAAAATGREAAMREIGLLRHLSLRFFRSLSTSPAPSPAAASASTDAAQKPKRRKKKNLFEVAQFLPNWGIGFQMAKTHWQGTSYRITKINLYKDGRHGKAWGVFHKDGQPSADGQKKISGVHKRGWRYIPEPRKKKLPEDSLFEQTLAS